MTGLSLRLRIGLFFALMGLGGILSVLAGLWVGFARGADAGLDAALIQAGLIAALGTCGLIVLVWMLFDEHVAKPLEALAAQLRVAPHTAGTKLPVEARYLGDLAPAAEALLPALRASVDAAPEVPTAPSAERLMLDILSEIPVAVLVLNAAHRIVLYDGQACEILEREAPARVGGSIFDYFEENGLREAAAQRAETGLPRQAITLRSLGGRTYAGHICRLAEQDGYTLMLEALDVEAARPLTFDISLLEAHLSEELSLTRLSDLTFVVFDTETTGLDPARDAVVQLAAVRVLRGQIVPGEQIDCLVDPGRRIPEVATKVHGITNQMVAGQSAFAEVCARFCSFATDAVVVAHNAPFDMAFVEAACVAEGRPFEPPVLDTVLMSAVVFGGAAQHTLDALCARMGIDIPEAERHTALGDARATAQALIGMIAALEARGIDTFGAYQEEARKHRGLMRRTAASAG